MKRMIITAEKESFVVRVLVKKVIEGRIECKFVPSTVDDINTALDGTSLVVVYTDENTHVGKDVLHFISERMREMDGSIILISEKLNMKELTDQVSDGLIYETFTRPVNNEDFVKTVSDYFDKKDNGELKKKILIVDDDAQYLSLVRQWLKDEYKVSVANSGLQAIKYLGKNKVDLILLDHEMPVTSGPQVLEMLRSDEETKSIPVMFLTGKSDKESVMKVLDLRPEGYFLKSIQKEELIEKLQEYFILHK